LTFKEFVRRSRALVTKITLQSIERSGDNRARRMESLLSEYFPILVFLAIAGVSYEDHATEHRAVRR